jgi:uncharacterized membrane protein YeaQ/YmgE (transglycosylase-associated protein family)
LSTLLPGRAFSKTRPGLGVHGIRYRYLEALSTTSWEKSIGILTWIVFGLIAGIIAKLRTPGRDPGGCIITMLIGVAGAFVGGFLYELLTGRQQMMQFDFGSLAVAVIGAVILLILYRLLAGPRA